MYTYDQFSKKINEILKHKNKSEEFIDKYTNMDIILYGAGHAAEYYVRYLTQGGCHIIAVIDNGKKMSQFMGYPVYTLEQAHKLLDLKRLPIVISAPSAEKEIKNSLNGYTADNNVYCFETELYVYYGTCFSKYSKFLSDNISRLYKVYAMLADETSRIHMMGVLEGRLLGDTSSISKIWDTNQYWPVGLFSFSTDEVMIECGTSDGKNLMEFLELVDRKFDHIYCFEPDPLCEDILSRIIHENGNGKIEYIKKGTWDKSTTLHFNSDKVDSGLSKVDSSGEINIDVVSLDEYIRDSRVTYIKMDIEGSELATLHGAETIIRNQHPKLAICIYHKDDDIVNIPEYLASINPEYRFYSRHHNCNMTETVLYAL